MKMTKQKIFGSTFTSFWGMIPIICIVILELTNVISLWSAIIMLVLWIIVIQGNAEIFLIAFIMAMVIRCFSIEVYKIPTGSMEPTLHGDYEDGDRILADKVTFLIQPIRRFDVVLFRFPLDKTTNFIKRVVGMPNEELTVKMGDLFYRQKGENQFKIAKKSLRIEDSIWMPVYNWTGTDESLQDGWDLPSNRDCYEIKGGRLSLHPGNSISYNSEIRDRYLNTNSPGGSHTVSDIKLSFRCRTEKAGGEIRTTINTQKGNFMLRLFPAKNNPPDSESPNLTWHFRLPPSDLLPYPSELDYDIPSIHQHKLIPVGLKFEPAQDHLVEILNFDGSIYVRIDNEIVAKDDYIVYLDDAHYETETTSEPITIDVAKYPAEIWDISIMRDVYYAGDYGFSVLKENEPLTIPDGKYLMIGDNVPNSKDGRSWRMMTLYLKNGKQIQLDADLYQPDNNGIVRIKRDDKNRGGDIWGQSWPDIKSDDILKTATESYPFVSSDEIFGRGLVVYWPLKRVKFIR